MSLNRGFMSDDDVLSLLDQLLHADYESDVVRILTEHGLWDNSDCWRLVGDDENNFSTIGAQQASAEAALVEKVVNSVDARLTQACLRAGIDPTGPAAPQSISDAADRFFGSESTMDKAKGITLAVTGARARKPGNLSLTICDIGEGQVPDAIPETFMSIGKKNKLRIPFVQGKFNMGGTGALMFCGTRKLQLLITRRDPDLLGTSTTDARDLGWGVTVVRRESPPKGFGQVRNSYFKYLAPVGSDVHPGQGAVLALSHRALKLMPESNSAYARPMNYGSCIKLYEYDTGKGHSLRQDGLLSKLEIRLPSIALPVRIHECRDGFGGKAGSYDTNLIGLQERLEAGRGDNLENGYPTSLSLSVRGEPMKAKIYALKKDKAKSYRSNQGIVFAINGQTHGSIPKSFFERAKVKMSRLAKSLIIVVDCSEFSVKTREDLFKNSRDRLNNGSLRREIEAELELQIKDHPGLKELRLRRQRDEVTERLSDSKPLGDVLKAIIKTSPSLSKIFISGDRLSTPYPSGPNGTSTSSRGKKTSTFKGRRHPTFFRFEKLKDGETLSRTAELGRRCQFGFLTDVDNDYFHRDKYYGTYHVEIIGGDFEGRELTTSVSLFNGVAHWNVVLPDSELAEGDELVLQMSINDSTLLEPIVNIAKLKMVKKTARTPGNKQNSKKQYPNHPGSDLKSAGGGISLPEIHKIRSDRWKDYDFDKYSACTMIDEQVDNESDDSVYKFYVNVENVYLETDMKNGKVDPQIVESRFVYGVVLIGLALIHDERTRNANSPDPDSDSPTKDDTPSLKAQIEQVTRALGPFLAPMVDYLGNLAADDVSQLAALGDEE